MLSFVLVAAGLWVGLLIVRYVVTVVQLLKIELKKAPSRAVDPELIPAGTRALLDDTARVLVGLGFQRPLYVEGEPTFVLPDFNEPESVLFLDHQSEAAIAMIRVHEDGSPFEPTRVTFMTRFEDGALLQTVNAYKHLCFAQNPSTLIEDPLALDLQSQWAAHQMLSASRGVRPVLFDEDLVTFFQKLAEEDLKHASARGELIEKTPGRFVLALSAAFRLAHKMIRAAPVIARHRKERAARAQPIAIPLDVQVALYRRGKAFQAKQTPRAVMTWIFGITAILSLLSFLPWSDGLAGAGILAAVVLLHELGHFAAMRAFGYKDTSIFFLPFFGGATIGSKDNVKPREEIIVLLAGPVPGLALGVALAWFGYAEEGLLRHAVLMLIGINALNLLPIFPLDGGRIARSLLFSRSIALDVIFQLGAVLLCFAGAYASDSYLIAIPGVFTLLGLSRTVKVSKLAAEVDANAGPRDAEVLRVVNRSLPMQAYYSERFGLARMIEKQLAVVRTTVLGGIGWGAVYSAVLAAGIGGTVLVLAHRLPGDRPPENSRRSAEATFAERSSKMERRVNRNCSEPQLFGRTLDLGTEDPGLGLFICTAPVDRETFREHLDLPPGLLLPAPWDSGALNAEHKRVRRTLAAIHRGDRAEGLDARTEALYRSWLERPKIETFRELRRLAGVTADQDTFDSGGTFEEPSSQVLMLQEDEGSVFAQVQFPTGVRGVQAIADWFCALGCTALDARVKTIE